MSRRGQPRNQPRFDYCFSNASLRLEGNQDHLGLTSRFVQTLLKKVPDCVDTNPVKVAFSIAKVIIEINYVSVSLFLEDRLNIISDGGNKDELAQRLEDTANRLLAVERELVVFWWPPNRQWRPLNHTWYFSPARKG